MSARTHTNAKISVPSWWTHHGDCLEVLRAMPDASVDSIVTDPPYGLSFMGKRWDYDVPSEEIWRECLRVLKPGGHLLAFAGTRTQHRMAVRIENAGFEIRDMIAWVYGSGFPKSLDVSKAIDKMDAAEAQQARQYRFTAWLRSTGVTSAQINAATSTNMGRHYTSAASQPAIMTREHLEACRHLFGDVPKWVEREVDIRSVESKNFAARTVVGQSVGTNTRLRRPGMPCQNNQKHEYSLTAPATDAARQWAGWGTALKPALEPITVARKPLEGTVAANVLEHGTGALNIDGCRVGTEVLPAQLKGVTRIGTFQGADGNETPERTGRSPANLIHDGSDEVLELFPVTKERGNRGPSVSSGTRRKEYDYGLRSISCGAEKNHGTPGDSGSAARFFYCAKASKADRDEGCERNTHPTVKPTALMRYLCRLVTPPGGTVLDPFMGSGSTGKAVVLEGFSFIGIEREAEYVEIAKARIAAAEAERGQMLPLEGEVA